MDGVLSLNKPRGVSSQQAVTRVKRALAAKKAGHAGTLDPEATGVLIICLERATRLFDAMQGLEKEYLATVRLGIATDTYDATGQRVAEAEVPPVGRDELERVLDGFRGRIEQMPPPFSALKHQGRPLYQWARRGVVVEKAARTVTVHALDVVELCPASDVGGPKEVRLRVVCSRGTYIRSLAHDLGQRLGCGAHLSALERTRIGPFRVEEAMPLHDVEAHPEVAATRVVPLDKMREALAATGNPGPETTLTSVGEDHP